MKLVLVNHCHPDRPHVCALRMREFARALARKGHQVVLLTGTLDDAPSPLVPSSLPAALKAHDWRKPFSLACTPTGRTMLRRARTGDLVRPLGKAVLALNYLLQAGVHADWRDGCAPWHAPLARHFGPDIVWSTFGNSTSWVIARDLARAADCPWVADLKDHWHRFVPPPLTGLIANRFADAALMTGFSGEHAETVRRWFNRDAAIVYSGIDPALYPASEPDDGRLTVTLTGAVYDRQNLSSLLDGIAIAAEAADGDFRSRMAFRYAGHDHAMVRECAQRLSTLIDVRIDAQLPLGEWLAVLTTARLNCYVKSHTTFHHKIFDLLGAGRPILTLPAETGEALEIAGDTGVPLLAAGTPDDVARTVSQVLSSDRSEVAPDRHRFSWDSRADGVIRLFEGLLAGDGA
jgi:NAD(P)-dependent dehydrogenase (short-subunit alcohol dehydrogenase family)